MDVGTLPDLNRLDIEALKALVVEQREQHLKALSSKTLQVEHLKLVVEKLRRMIFGAKSEKAVIGLSSLNCNWKRRRPNRLPLKKR